MPSLWSHKSQRSFLAWGSDLTSEDIEGLTPIGINTDDESGFMSVFIEKVGLLAMEKTGRFIGMLHAVLGTSPWGLIRSTRADG